MPLTAVADYALAQIVYTQFKGLWSIYYTVRFPHFVNMRDELRRRRFITEISILTGGFILLALLVGWVYSLSIGILFPSEYVGSVRYVYWTCLIFAAGTPGYGAETYFRSTANQSAQRTLRLTASFATVIVSLSLVYWLSDLGILIGRLSSNLILSMVGIWLFANNADPLALSNG